MISLYVTLNGEKCHWPKNHLTFNAKKVLTVIGSTRNLLP